VPTFHPFTTPVWLAAAGVFLYVTTISQLARREAEPHHPGMEVWLPFAVLSIGPLLVIPVLAHEVSGRIGFLAAYAAALGLSMGFALRMRAFASTPNLPRALERKQAIRAELPVWIGRLISGLMFLQAAFVLSVGGALADVVAAVLLVGWVLNRLLARWFYAS